MQVCLAANRQGYRGPPNHFPFEGMVHPITLDLYAAESLIHLFFEMFGSTKYVMAHGLGLGFLLPSLQQRLTSRGS